MKRLLFSVMALAVQPVLAQDYFQQQADYAIHVRLDDEAHVLHAFEELLYVNNSPDTLTFLYFHLWPNAYRNKETALAKQLVRQGHTELFYATPDEMGYIDSLAFTLDGLPCVWEYDETHIDICKILLEKPLLPGRSVKVATPFRVKLPSGSISRLGHIGQSYQVTQWYPKPAVYDTAGWHPMPYLTQGEFYSEYGSFDVYIEIPENYTVGATGDLQTEAERLRLEQKAKETEAWIGERRENGDWQEHLSEEFPASAPAFKTLHYHQDNVHDFAWFADKRFRVLQSQVKLPASGDTVDLWTMFTDRNARLWSESPEYMRDAIYYYSLWNGDYPYRQATAVDGTISAGGGMEYPNVTVIGDAGNALALETVIMHEVGHNWFYGILGSNERNYAWLDEGLNSYNEQRYLGTKYPGGIAFSKDPTSKLHRFAGLHHYRIDEQHYLTYLLMARPNKDQPLNLPSEEYSPLNYGMVVYSKTAIFMNYLRHYLGDATMDAGMHRYFEENKFRHPYPKSLEQALEAEAGEDLRWFFDDVVNSRAKLDYSVQRVRSTDSTVTVTIKNTGGLASPAYIALFDGEKEVAGQWIHGFGRDTTLYFHHTATKVVIDPERIMPEIRRENNYARVNGLFRKTEPIHLKFLGSIEQPWKNQLYFTPVLGANVPNGWMPGIAFYNFVLPPKKFTYVLVPMFATKGSEPVGLGEIVYMFTPEESVFETIDLGIKGKRFIYRNTTHFPALSYARIEPYLRFNFRPPSYSGLFNHRLVLSSVFTPREEIFYSFTDGAYREVVNAVDRFNRATYIAERNHPVYNTAATWALEHHKEFVRTSVELKNTVHFQNRSQLSLRLFGGVFLTNTSSNPLYNWRMDGQDFRTDYAYDAELPDRSGLDPVLSRQMMETHGGIKVPTAWGQSSAWLGSANVKLKLGRTPFGIFADAGYSASGNFVADGGAYLSFIPDIIEIYVPLIYSENVRSEKEANGRTWTDLVRFQLNLSKLNPFPVLRRFDRP